MKVLQLNEASNYDILYEAQSIDKSSKHVTVDFFIAGKNAGKIRKGSGFQNLGVDPDAGEINVVFEGREVMSIPVSKGTLTFEKLGGTRFPTLVAKLPGFTMYVTWS